VSDWDTEAEAIRAARERMTSSSGSSRDLDRLIAEARGPVADRIAELRLEGRLPAIRQLELEQLEAQWARLGGRRASR